MKSMSIGPILTNLRIERGFYQKQLASALNLSVATISNYEQELHYPDLQTLEKLANYYDVSTDYLLGRTENRFNFDKLNTPLLDTYTYENLLDTILQLSPAGRQSLKDYLEYLVLKEPAAPEQPEENH